MSEPYECDDIRSEIEGMFAELSGAWPGAQIADALGLRKEDLRHAYVSGKPTRGGARPHPPHPKRQEAMRMLAEGVPLKRTARLLGVSKASLHRWRKAHHDS